AIALNVLLSRLFVDHAPLPIPGFYDQVRVLTEKEKQAFRKLPFDGDKFRREMGMVSSARYIMEKGLNLYEQTWRRPSATVIAQEASSIKGASNQVLPKASAIVSCRIVPDQDPEKVLKQLQAFFTTDPPWGVEVTVTP